MLPAETGHQTLDLIDGFGYQAIIAAGILIVVYAFIITERLNQAVIALTGACILILTGVINQELAVEGIDFNTIFLLIGMMVIVTIAKRTGVFQFVAILSAKSVRGNPRLLLIILPLITAVFSALLDNVTTVLLIVPITLLLTEQLKLSPYPFLFALIFSSNIGGTATLIGDPPNILIGSAVGLSFTDFVYNVGPVSFITMIILFGVFDLIWGRNLKTSLKARAHLLRYNAREALTDIPLLIKSMITMALVLAGFVIGHHHGIEAGTVALSGAALLLLLDTYYQKSEDQTKSVQKTLEEVEWETIFFFMGLFILVKGVEHTGLLQMLGEELINLTNGDLFTAAMVILWSSSIVSAVVNNIPFVATMIPMMEAMAPDMGGEQAIMPLWWALSLGACLGGNGSLVGASANVMVASFAERAGQRISFVKFMMMAFPLMIFTIFISMIYVWLVYFGS